MNFLTKKHLSKEHRNKLSKAHLGKHHTQETKDKMSESKKGNKNPMYKRKHTQESKRKMSKSYHNREGNNGT